MKVKKFSPRVFFLISFLVSNACYANKCSEEAQRAIETITPVLERDAASLWGKSLSGPLAIINPQTRATESVDLSNSKLGCKLSQLADNQPIANTCLEIDGVKTAFVIAPLPSELDELVRLITHERWHCLQTDLGLSAGSDNNAHLDTEANRVALRLEFRALSEALAQQTYKWKKHAKAALAFRSSRGENHQLNTKHLLQEAMLERNEGLAEYTGQFFAYPKNDQSKLINQLKEADRKESYLRSFAYLTGPAYGRLLERCDTSWIKKIATNFDFPTALQKCLGANQEKNKKAYLKLLGNANYNAIAVRESERLRTEVQSKRIELGKKMFGKAPYVELELINPNVQFDPNTLFAIPELGLLYQGMTLNADWGKLTATSGVLLDSDWRYVRVAIENNQCSTTGSGWNLTLVTPWELFAADDGVCRLRKRSQK